MPSYEPSVAVVWRLRACSLGTAIAAAFAILVLTSPLSGMRRGGPGASGPSTTWRASAAAR